MEFVYLEHTADLLFQAFGKTKEGLIVNSGRALCNAIIDLRGVNAGEKIELEVKIEEEKFEEVLFKFLEELLFQIETREMVFSEFEVKELREGYLKIECRGEKIDSKKHEVKTNVKAITRHDFRVWFHEGKWNALVLCDI
ncbi:MAG: archease [archaeon]|nr:archease [Candidatus Micrarchaeota archaeon]